MPRLLERDDVMRTAVNLGRAEKVWSERLVTGSGDMTFRVPEGGSYQVILLNPTFHVREQNPSGCWGFAHRSSLHSRFCRVGSFA